MPEPRARDRLFAVVTVLLAVLLLPAAFLRHPGHGRERSASWALGLRFPAEDLTGLAEPTLAAFTAARTDALWRHGQLIGLTSGYRDPATQQRLYDAGSPRLVLPPAESGHVRGVALDVRPRDGARWLEDHGAAYDLYRIYDNEWWHFEHRPECAGIPPQRLPHPSAVSREIQDLSPRPSRPLAALSQSPNTPSMRALLRLASERLDPRTKARSPWTRH